MQLSILIRNLNEACLLEKLLQTLALQKTDFEYEVVVVDNESNDTSPAIIQQYGCKMVSIKRNCFSYGGALNLGLQACLGEVVLIISPHIILLQPDFLQRIPSFFNPHPLLAGLRFIQNTNTGAIVRSYCQGFEMLEYADDPDFFEKNNLNFIVNHCSAIRKSTWEQVPFDESLIACEDKKWSLEVLKKGFNIFYNVPCIYTYISTLDNDQKILKTAREVVAFETINSGMHPAYSTNKPAVFFNVFRSAMYRMKNELVKHRKLSRTIKMLRNK